MGVRFQPPFDASAYLKSKEKSKQTRDPKLNKRRHASPGTKKSPDRDLSLDSTLAIPDSEDEFPPIEKVLRGPPIYVDLTGNGEARSEQPMPTLEQPFVDRASQGN